jgi:hypothetical protein
MTEIGALKRIGQTTNGHGLPPGAVHRGAPVVRLSCCGSRIARTPTWRGAMSSGQRPGQGPTTITADRGLGGWSPARLPADTDVKRWVDRMLPRCGMPVTCTSRR